MVDFAKALKAKTVKAVRPKPTLRPYQSDTMIEGARKALASNPSALGRAATGLGKAVALAALTEDFPGRVMVLVDVRKLVRQLAETIEWFTGNRPGVEMADERATNGDGWLIAPDRVVCSTFQTMLTGGEGRERFLKWNPNEFDAVFVDECEIGLSPQYARVIQHFQQNPKCKLFGCTATPMRSDGLAMANQYASVAFDLDIRWGIDQGWLVPGRQRFLRCPVDFSSLRVRDDGTGDIDYSEKEIGAKIINDGPMVEIAKGILATYNGYRSIVVMPDVSTARRVAFWLNSMSKGTAGVVLGEMTDEEKDEAFAGHQRGDFPILVSVMMLTKGYDDPALVNIYNCRKTRSKRLYAQIVGRGTRPLRGLLDNAKAYQSDPDYRRGLIADSDKPTMQIFNLVGLESDVMDVTLLDILGDVEDERVLKAARRAMKEDEDLDLDEALALARSEVEAADEADDLLAELVGDKLEDEIVYRPSIHLQVDGELEIHEQGAVGARPADYSTAGPILAVPDRQLQVLRNAGVEDEVIAKMNPEMASRMSREIIARHRQGLCSYRQARALIRSGYGKDEVKRLTKSHAAEMLGNLRANGWQRNRADSVETLRRRAGSQAADEIQGYDDQFNGALRED